MRPYRDMNADEYKQFLDGSFFPRTVQVVPIEEPVYRIVKTSHVQGDVYAMQGATYLGRLMEIGGDE